ncbi:MAG: carboxymuconolactone decarboxylase family protein [Pseudoxanthomonas sp.]
MSARLHYRSLAAAALRGLGDTHQQIASSDLPPTLVDLVYLRVSQINGCTYCLSTHSRDLLKAGVSMDKLMLLPAWREAGDVYSEIERAALQWAESLTLVSSTGAPDADYEVLVANFNDTDAAFLTIAIGLINTYNRMAIGFRQPPVRLS